jgi:hypothetical protein
MYNKHNTSSNELLNSTSQKYFFHFIDDYEKITVLWI